MKTLTLLLLISATFMSCAPKVQVVTLRGSNVNPDKEGLVLDNDTLTIRYNFASERGQMHITLLNKLNQPLYVDWKRSSFIVGQDKLDYWYDVSQVQMTGSFSGSRYRVSYSGTISKEDPVGFIPPQTKLEKVQFVLVPSGSLPLTGSFTTAKEDGKWSEPNKNVEVTSYVYSADQSPLQFRNYFTLSTDKDFKTEFHINTKFWASDVRVMPKVHALDYEEPKPNTGFVTYIVSFKKADSFYVPVVEP